MAITKASRNASEKLDKVLAVYECYDHQHAIAILTIDHPPLLSEICDVLLALVDPVRGSMAAFKKRASRILQELQWQPAQLVIRLTTSEKVIRREVYSIGYIKSAILWSFITDENNPRNFDLRVFRQFPHHRVANVIIGSANGSVGLLDSRRSCVSGAGDARIRRGPTLFLCARAKRL